MPRVTISFSFDIEDEAIKQADEAAMSEWGSAIADLAYPKFGQSIDDAVLVQAVVESFIASSGKPWPTGTADDANLEYSGTVRREAR
jgi:hypothetical protein